MKSIQKSNFGNILGNYESIGDTVGKYGTIGAMLLVFIIFTISTNRFIQVDNLLNILRQTSTLSIVALGMTAAMASGEFDMTTGSVVGLAGVLVTGMQVKGIAFPIALLVILIVGFAIGMFNGIITTKVKIPSIIVTLGMSSVVTGLIFMYTKGKAVYGGLPKSFTNLGRGYLGPIPILVIIMLIFTAITYFILNKTIIGRYIYAVGGNSKAANLSGINTAKYKMIGLIMSSMFAAITGVLLSSRLGSGQPTAGASFTMDGLSSVFIGMTTIRIGRANIIGTVIGVTLLGIVNNGLNLLGFPYYIQDISKGLIMIAAVAFAASKNELKFFGN